MELENFIKKYRWTPEFVALFRDCQTPDLLHSDRWSMVYDYADLYCPEYKAIVTEITTYIESIIKE